METVYKAESIVDAHLVKDALEAAEIPAFISGEYLIGGIGQLPARDFIRVMVPDSSLPRARAIVQQVEAMLAAGPESAAEGDSGEQPGLLPA